MATATKRNIRREMRRVMPDGRLLIAKAELHYIDGNASSHFALTGEEWKSALHERRGWERSGLLSCGRLGDELVKAFPQLERFERMHLADEDGVPMHAVTNGWYWYSGKGHEYERNSPYSRDPVDTPRERTARHLRIDESELPDGLTEEGFSEFVESLRPRWAEEAAEAVAFLA